MVALAAVMLLAEGVVVERAWWWRGSGDGVGVMTEEGVAKREY